MSLDLEPLGEAIDPVVLKTCHVTVVGCGGSHHLTTSLARSGVRDFRLVDPDHVAPENLCRADFGPTDLGRPKVEVLGRALEVLGARVETHVARVQEVPEAVLRRTSLMIAATDSFPAQAAVNRLALRHRTPALFCGLAAGGRGGEVVFWYPGLPCFRCLVSQRYQRYENESPAAVSSRGATLFDLMWLDGIVGQLALGLLLRRTATRYARHLALLGDRNFLRLKIDPGYRQSGRDHVQSELNIPADNPHFTGWCVAAQGDPQRGEPPCTDCRSAGHRAFLESSA